MTHANNSNATVVNNVSYNPANQLLTMNVANGYGNFNETRTYNTLGQLSGLNNGAENLTYNYPTGTNNGKVTSKYNAVSGETVTYTYDSLNRLASAGSGSNWGDSYSYDGFGNLVSKTVTAGSAPSLSIAMDANNHITSVFGLAYDSNGNETSDGNNHNYSYDAENRLSSAQQGSSSVNYGYDAQNRRIFAWPGTVDSSSTNNVSGYTLNIYAPSGQKLAAYQITIFMTGSPIAAPNLFFSLTSSNAYFGGKRLAPQDQLGSAGDFYPYGEAKGSNNPQDTWSYATYWRDSASGLDYANNRYYSNQYARLLTPDPYKGEGGGAGNPRAPQSWNKYTYTAGDPVNRVDPAGTDYCDAAYYLDDVYGGYYLENGTVQPFPSCTDSLYGVWSPGAGDYLYWDLPQLDCQFMGPVFGQGYWTTYQGAKTWVVPINLIYQATGGNGSYTFTETQSFVDIELDSVQGRAPTVTASSGQDKPATNLTPGSATATYSDQPGLGVQKTTANFVAFSIKTFFTYVSVTSGDGQTVNCPTVEWSNFVTLSQKNGNEYGYGTDSIIQVFQPTRQ